MHIASGSVNRMPMPHATRPSAPTNPATKLTRTKPQNGPFVTSCTEVPIASPNVAFLSAMRRSAQEDAADNEFENHHHESAGQRSHADAASDGAEKARYQRTEEYRSEIVLIDIPAVGKRNAEIGGAGEGSKHFFFLFCFVFVCNIAVAGRSVPNKPLRVNSAVSG